MAAIATLGNSTMKHSKKITPHHNISEDVALSPFTELTRTEASICSMRPLGRSILAAYMRHWRISQRHGRFLDALYFAFRRCCHDLLMPVDVMKGMSRCASVLGPSVVIYLIHLGLVAWSPLRADE
jgi:hypothetical protein